MCIRDSDLIRTQGAGSNYTNQPLRQCEPAGHGIGRSRGGLTTKIHTAVDGNGRPLAVIVTGGQRNDQAMLAGVLDEIVVPRRGVSRVRPDAVIADRAYSSGVARRLLRSRKITAVIPQKSDEIAARQRRGSAGGRPPACLLYTSDAADDMQCVDLGGRRIIKKKLCGAYG